MRLPFVSRERFDELKERATALETENRRIAEEIFSLRIAAAEATAAPKTDPLQWEPIKGRPTIATIQADANREAFKRSTVVGSRAVAEELAESQAVLLRRANGK